ncbi:uncharacterized protein C8A04DRAFT_32763 [Dichotomopilus funicola]|uniref:Uncharacterized protein n=1 Tax=Dichotomopilus funicola TaxID=1934379 RepID=A0AAN6UWD2_9PEZI|nr:hypothetical protein C8A04DRAFT_32763 [Dichotomopilus funicola]
MKPNINLTLLTTALLALTGTANAAVLPRHEHGHRYGHRHKHPLATRGNIVADEPIKNPTVGHGTVGNGRAGLYRGVSGVKQDEEQGGKCDSEGILGGSLSIHFQGPIHIHQVAVYKLSGPNTGNNTADSGTNPEKRATGQIQKRAPGIDHEYRSISPMGHYYNPIPKAYTSGGPESTVSPTAPATVPSTVPATVVATVPSVSAPAVQPDTAHTQPWIPPIFGHHTHTRTSAPYSNLPTGVGSVPGSWRPEVWKRPGSHDSLDSTSTSTSDSDTTTTATVTTTFTTTNIAIAMTTTALPSSSSEDSTVFMTTTVTTVVATVRPSTSFSVTTYTTDTPNVITYPTANPTPKTTGCSGPITTTTPRFFKPKSKPSSTSSSSSSSSNNTPGHNVNSPPANTHKSNGQLVRTGYYNAARQRNEGVVFVGVGGARGTGSQTTVNKPTPTINFPDAMLGSEEGVVVLSDRVCETCGEGVNDGFTSPSHNLLLLLEFSIPQDTPSQQTNTTADNGPSIDLVGTKNLYTGLDCGIPIFNTSTPVDKAHALIQPDTSKPVRLAVVVDGEKGTADVVPLGKGGDFPETLRGFS